MLIQKILVISNEIWSELPVTIWLLKFGKLTCIHKHLTRISSNIWWSQQDSNLRTRKRLRLQRNGFAAHPYDH